MKAEQLSQLRELLVARRGEIEPEEVIPLQVIPDSRFVDRREARHDEAKSLVRAVVRRCSRLPDRHLGLLWSLNRQERFCPQQLTIVLIEDFDWWLEAWNSREAERVLGLLTEHASSVSCFSGRIEAGEGRGLPAQELVGDALELRFALRRAFEAEACLSAA
jgi:hypothetical protein